MNLKIFNAAIIKVNFCNRYNINVLKWHTGIYVDRYIKMENLFITVFISDYVFPNQQKISLDYRLNGQKFLNNKISIAPIRSLWKHAHS